MSAPDPSTETEPPEMTPEARAIIGRARKSFAFSIVLLLVGFIAIGGALVYRASRASPETAPAQNYTAAAVKVPAGAEIVSAVAAGGKISVTYRHGSAVSMRIFDGKTGAVIGEIPVVSE